MKLTEKHQAILLRKQGYSIGSIAKITGVSKSSASLWVRNVELTKQQLEQLNLSPFTKVSVEKRRSTRLLHEENKRQAVISMAKKQIPLITSTQLWLIGVMLYWAEGGKTQRLVRFSNGDPEMIKLMMRFFREVCKVPESKFRGYIHIHEHLNHHEAENYWASISGISSKSFFKTYRKRSVNTQAKDALPRGVMDIYVLDTKLFLRLTGWAQGVFQNSFRPAKIAPDARVL